MSQADYKSRRSVRRTLKLPVLLSGEDGQHLAVTHTIDVSEAGAKLKLDNAVSLPDRFNLTLSQKGEVRRSCKLVWRTDDAVGVRFIDAK